MTHTIKPHAVVKLIRQMGVMTPHEVRIAFSWPSDIFAEEALLLIEEYTGQLSRIEGYWSAKVSDE
jgi:hypothetical protein